MGIGRRQEEEQRQARSATQQCVDAVAAQERARVVMWGVPDGGIRIAVTPGQDGGAVDDEVARTGEATMQRQAHHDHQEGFGDRRSGPRRPLPLL